MTRASVTAMLGSLTETATSRAVILLIYLGCFFIEFALLLHAASYREGFQRSKYVDIIVQAYQVPMAIVLAGVASSKASAHKLDSAPLLLLYAPALFWNAFLVYQFLSFDYSMTHYQALHKMSTDDLE